MKPKFKIGDEIFFMKYSEPSKGVVMGIAFVVGKFEDTSFSKTGGDIDNPSITYCVGSYNTVDESKAYSTKEEFLNALFSKL